MDKVLIVGGTFDNDGGKPSGLLNSIIECTCREPSFEVYAFNGGFVADLHDNILPSVTDYKIVFWFANVSNDEVKLRDVKAINPKVILITSKRNDNDKYTFAELISRSLAIKANLTIEFSKKDDKFNMMVFDPLGNVFYCGTDVNTMCSRLIYRIKQLTKFTRVPTVQDTEHEAPVVPGETEFFEFAHNCADIFHNLIRPAKGTERFLGNMSFRCMNGFPSFKDKKGSIYVSRRNVDKSDINAASFVPVYLDKHDTVKYFGENKPSVDTPVQLRLYKYFPWARYMIHAHCNINTLRTIPEAFTIKTENPIPCGALEEVDEIINTYIKCSELLWYPWHMFPPRLLAVNLAGHGCILIASDIEILQELQKHKNNCFVERPMPESIDLW